MEIKEGSNLIYKSNIIIFHVGYFASNIFSDFECERKEFSLTVPWAIGYPLGNSIRLHTDKKFVLIAK